MISTNESVMAAYDYLERKNALLKRPFIKELGMIRSDVNLYISHYFRQKSFQLLSDWKYNKRWL